MVDPAPETPAGKLSRPGLGGNARGAFWMIASGAGFTLYLVLAKELSARHDPGFLAFWRALIALFMTLPFLIRSRLAILATDRFGLILTRSLFGTMGFIFSLYAVSAHFNLPLSQFNALSFSRPLFVTLLAIVILGERVGWHRWGAIAVGFLGVLVMLAPGLSGRSEVDFGTVLALMSTLAFAGAIILVKTLTRTHRPLTLLIWANLLSTLLLTPFAIWRATLPSLQDAGLILVMSLAGLAGQFCYITAMSRGEASFLASLDYIRLPMAALADWLIFRLLPGLWVWVGAGIIIAATLYITLREMRRKQSRTAGPPGPV